MNRVLSIIRTVLVGIIVILVLALFAIGWWQGFYKPLLISCIILIILLVALLLYIRGLDDEIDEYDQEIKNCKLRINQLELDNNRLKKKLASASTEASPSQTQNNNNTPSTQQEKNETTVPTEGKTENNPTTNPTEKPPVKEYEEEFYSSPNANGEFDRSHARMVKGDDCFYKIVWKREETHGKLEILEKRDYSRLLGGYKTDCLYPVCEVANSKSDGRIITMISAGQVLLQENKWKIDNGRKIKINID